MKVPQGRNLRGCSIEGGSRETHEHIIIIIIIIAPAEERGLDLPELMAPGRSMRGFGVPGVWGLWGLL